MRRLRIHPDCRSGGVYIAVLGTALIVSMLGLTALTLQRVQNRMLTEATDIRQAQLNAESAIELALRMIASDDAWRTNRNSGNWIIKQDLGSGSASVRVNYPPYASVSDSPDLPIQITAIGYHGALAGSAPRTEAEQRIQLMLDARRDPLDCLRNGQQDQDLPDWNAVWSYYQSRGTQLNIASLPSRTPNSPHFARNHSFNYGAWSWSDDPPGLPESDIDVESYSGRNDCLKVRRDDRRAGAANRLDVPLLKPATQYTVNVEVHAGHVIIPLLGLTDRTNRFRISLVTQFPDNNYVTYPGEVTQVSGGWRTITSKIETPAWSQPPSAAYFVVNTDTGSSSTFYIDNLDVYESGARFIYQKVLSKDLNQLYSGAPTNEQGIYWIDCAGQNLVIERSRLMATLLLINPGPGSRIAYGPYDWSPPSPGFPTLLVNGSFTISGTLASDPRLREQENNVNYNPTGAPNRDGNTDNDNEPHEYDDEYDSQIRSLVAVSGNLTYENNPPIRGQVIVGGATTGTPDFVYTPEALLSPAPGFYNYRYDPRPASIQKAVRN